MRKSRNLPCFILCVTLLLTSILGITFIVAPAQADDEPFVITAVGRTKANYGGVEGNLLLAAIEEAANVKFEWEIPPQSGFAERLNIIMASGEYPDLIVTAINSNFRNYMSSGLLMPLDDYLENCPNILAMVPDYMFNLTTSLEDNMIYGIPVSNPTFIQGIFWRQNWLENVGIEKIPETLEECVEAWKRFTFNDPDQNGKNDTYGFTTTEHLDCASALFPALGATLPLSWKADVEGNVYYGLNCAGYYEALLFLRDMYEQGILDPEYLLISTEENHEQRYTQGYVGSVFMNPVVSTWTRVKQASEEANDNCSTVFSYAPIGPDGSFGANASTTGSMGAWAITIGAEKPERIMEFMDLMHTDQWYFTQANGVAGVHYETYDEQTDTITRTEEQKERWALDYNPQLWFSRDKSDIGFYSRTVTYMAEDFRTAFAYNNNEEYYDLDISYGYIPAGMTKLDESMPDWTTTLYELQNKVVMGTGDTETLAGFIEKLNSAGLEQATQEMQAYYNTTK